MSNSRKQQHLTTSPNGVFQYYLTLPAHLSSEPRLPAQVRWTLGRDASLARTLAQLLDAELSLILKPGDTLVTPELVRERLEQAKAWLKRTLDNAANPWGALPEPSHLGKQDLTAAKQKLAEASAKQTTLYSVKPGGELILSITPSDALQSALGLRFHRLDWPLGTSEQEKAQDAAVYAFAAISHLEQHTPDAALQHPATFNALALHEYLRNARPDGGAHVADIPPDLPGSLAAYRIHSTLTSLSWPKPRYSAFVSRQLESGLYTLELASCTLKDKHPILASRGFSLTLPTTSAIIATLLNERLTSAVESTLQIHLRRAPTDASLEQARQELEALTRGFLGSMLEQSPLPSLPNARPLTDSNPAPVDPAKHALATALAALLPEDQRSQLEALISNTKVTVIDSKAEQLNGITFGELAKRFQQAQIDEGAWTHVKTTPQRIARLKIIVELIGAHRRLKTLRRTDFLTLRHLLRFLPYGAPQLAARERISIKQLIIERTAPAINPRTAKSYFELAKSLIRYAQDQELIEHDITANLTFKTRNAPPPRRRTYTHEMLTKLVKGPVHTASQLPSWRMDEYKFWLPLLGLYTGARLGELCQLQLRDVRCSNNIWLINIDNSDGKQIKNTQSIRQVPLHEELIKLGFLDFVSQQKKKAPHTDAPLFDSHRQYSQVPVSHVASRWFGSYVQQCDLAQEKATFHGLRHTFIQQFRMQRLDMLIAKALVGHVDTSTTGGYGDIYPLHVLKEEIDQLDFSLDLTHVSYARYQSLRAAQAGKQIGRPAK
jgi:integrase